MSKVLGDVESKGNTFLTGLHWTNSMLIPKSLAFDLHSKSIDWFLYGGNTGI